MTVLVAREGEHALSIVEKVVPDVILMDALMPGTDGFETCRRLKQNQALAHVPIIFMTGLSETQHIIKGLEAGGVDYVTKPIVPGEVLARIRVHLANARMAHSARTALDAFGRFLLAASRTGRRALVHAASREAARASPSPTSTARAMCCRAKIQGWLHQCAAHAGRTASGVTRIRKTARCRGMQLIYIGQIGPDEYPAAPAGRRSRRRPHCAQTKDCS